MSKLGAKKQRALALAAQPAAPQAQLTHTRVVPPASSLRRSPVAYTDISWAQIVSILQDADQGKTERWADLRTRMLKSDDHLFSVYETRSSTVASARREVKPADVSEQYAQAAQLAADDCRALLESLPNIERTFYEALDADSTGYSIHEIIWEPRGTFVWPTELVWVHPRRFRWTTQYQPYLYDDGTAVARARELGLEQQALAAGMNGLPLTPNKYIVHVPQALPDYPGGGGILRACVRPWFRKMSALRFWMRGAEIAGNPRMVGKITHAATPDALDELFSALEQLSGDGATVVREGVEIEILDAKMSGSGSVWDSFVKSCDAAMSKAFLGSTLNVEVGDSGGNRSLGESQGDLTIWPRVSKSARMLANTFERQLFKPFLEFNRHRYGGYVFVPRLDLVLYEEKATVDDLAVNAGVVTVDEIRQSRGLDPLGPERGGEDLVTAPDMPNIPQGMPAPTLPKAGVVDSAAPVEKAADTALNGAQIDSLLTIVQNVAAGLIPRETGINLITAAFPLTPEQAERIMGSVGAGFVPTPDGGSQPAQALVEAPAAVPLRQPPWETARSLSLKSGG